MNYYKTTRQLFKVVIFSCFIGALTSCGFVTTHKDFRSYVDSFEEEYNTEIDFSVTFQEDLRENTNHIGICTYIAGTPRVYIDTKFWEKTDDISREALIYHELGHCKFRLEHYNEEFSDGTAKSIMHAGNYNVVSGYWARGRSYYIEELRQRIKEHSGELF